MKVRHRQNKNAERMYSYLLKANVMSILLEALPAHVQVVFTDNTPPVAAGTATNK